MCGYLSIYALNLFFALYYFLLSALQISCDLLRHFLNVIYMITSWSNAHNCTLAGMEDHVILYTNGIWLRSFLGYLALGCRDGLCTLFILKKLEVVNLDERHKKEYVIDIKKTRRWRRKIRKQYHTTGNEDN